MLYSINIRKLRCWGLTRGVLHTGNSTVELPSKTIYTNFSAYSIYSLFCVLYLDLNLRSGNARQGLWLFLVVAGFVFLSTEFGKLPRLALTLLLPQLPT